MIMPREDETSTNTSMTVVEVIVILDVMENGVQGDSSAFDCFCTQLASVKFGEVTSEFIQDNKRKGYALFAEFQDPATKVDRDAGRVYPLLEVEELMEKCKILGDTTT